MKRNYNALSETSRAEAAITDAVVRTVKAMQAPGMSEELEDALAAYATADRLWKEVIADRGLPTSVEHIMWRARKVLDVRVGQIIAGGVE